MELNEESLKTWMNMDKLDEEFNNFMHRVNEVNSIVKKLASTDKGIQKIGDEEARQYLGNDELKIEEDNIVLKISSSKTMVNKKALAMENNSPNEMSKEAFMEEISKDADRRYKERLVRKEKMETFKKQATLAFRRGEYEKALVLYNKAIEQIKDSPLLYNNRALTYINLGFFDKAKTDLVDWALRLNENCLKSWLLLAKIHHLNGNQEEFEKAIFEAKQRNPDCLNFIEEFIEELTK
ncbi:hypothetical protein GWI33_004657 [Rhynchophorus ferrugineus]|uniref:Uncharacterized protein n=1 Tax=Rhynchophorus ferrugineus TaxID=354439 RepID=A0A834ML66_RHYFE|nr:hypothetical protein GWI33_004657 [Rhynchophorus ferrugineus]